VKLLVLILLGIVVLSACGGASTNQEPYPTYNTSATHEQVDEEIAEPQHVQVNIPEVETTYVEVELAPVETLDLQGVLRIAQARREAIIRPSADEFVAGLLGREMRHMDMPFFPEPIVEVAITLENAIYDVQLFFELLQNIYGGYDYFGGDDVFLPILDYVIEQLEQTKDLRTVTIANILFEALNPVIHDNHFSINNRALGISYQFVVITPIFDPATSSFKSPVFERSVNGFRNRDTGLYVTALMWGDEPISMGLDEALRLSLDANGEFYYSFVYVQPPRVQTGLQILTIVYDNGDVSNHATRIINTLEPMWKDGPLKSLTIREGIPVVTAFQMGFPESATNPNAIYAQNFLDYATQLRDEPVIIIDLRTNGGGNGLLPTMFLYRLLDEIIPQNYFRISNSPYEVLVRGLQSDTSQNWSHISYETFRKYSTFAPVGDYHTIFSAPHRMVSNDNLFILLVDRRSASAAEAFADLMFSLDNALVIGQNTAGVLHTDLTYGRFLPNTRIHFGFGRSMFVHPQGHLPEGIGITPDIWVNGDALVATIALLNS